VGLSRFELLTPRLSSVCSNQLSYRPSDSATATSGQADSPIDERKRSRGLSTGAPRARWKADSLKTG
jgi:hypothetical protein